MTNPTELVLEQAVDSILMPPGGNVLLTLIGLLLLPRARRLAAIVLFVALGSLCALSIPVVASALERSLDAHPFLGDVGAAEAIVVLGMANVVRDDLGVPVPRGGLLERLRYAASVHRRTGLPLLVTGGNRRPGKPAEADVMARSLGNDFHVGVRFVENRSRNTAENAAYSAALLAPAGITRIVLVTHASHMIRAVGAFEDQGLTVVPAPIRRRFVSLSFTAFLPRVNALARSVAATREHLGRVWYGLRH